MNYKSGSIYELVADRRKVLGIKIRRRITFTVEKSSQTIPQIIFQKRRELKLTLDDLQRLSGVNRLSIWKLEKGKLRIRPSTINALAVAMNLEIPEGLIAKLEPHKLSSTPPTDLARRVMDKRLLLEMSQVAFGDLIGFSGGVVGNIENGKRISAESLRKIEEFLES